MSTRESEYQQALAWLFTRTRGGGPRTPERAAVLLDQLGLAAPPLTISVVGTNGKGSVASMTAAGLTAAGHKTGLFTSPHVESFRERISVDGRSVSEDAVTSFVNHAQNLRAHDSQLAPAFFEWTLALALSEYANSGASAAVLEAGVGGGSDATRAVNGVSLTVITNVDLDHTDTLGTTLEQIAADKAGAIRPNMPAISGVLEHGPRQVVRAAADRLGAKLHQYVPGAQGQPLFELPKPLSRALEEHPTREMNSRLAAAALRLLGADEASVLAGLRVPPLPARGERFVIGEPNPSGSEEVEVLLDGAHDPAAAQRLVVEAHGFSGAPRPYTLLFGALGRKQGAAVLGVLAEGARDVVVTEAMEGDGTVQGPAGTSYVTDPEAALEQVIELAVRHSAESGQPPLVVVAGSLYLAGRIRPLLRERSRRVPAAWEAGTR